jgi:ribosomal protein L40E
LYGDSCVQWWCGAYNAFVGGVHDVSQFNLASVKFWVAWLPIMLVNNFVCGTILGFGWFYPIFPTIFGGLFIWERFMLYIERRTNSILSIRSLFTRNYNDLSSGTFSRGVVKVVSGLMVRSVLDDISLPLMLAAAGAGFTLGKKISDRHHVDPTVTEAKVSPVMMRSIFAAAIAPLAYTHGLDVMMSLWGFTSSVVHYVDSLSSFMSLMRSFAPSFTLSSKDIDEIKEYVPDVGEPSALLTPSQVDEFGKQCSRWRHGVLSDPGFLSTCNSEGDNKTHYSLSSSSVEDRSAYAKTVCHCSDIQLLDNYLLKTVRHRCHLDCSISSLIATRPFSLHVGKSDESWLSRSVYKPFESISRKSLKVSILIIFVSTVVSYWYFKPKPKTLVVVEETRTYRNNKSWADYDTFDDKAELDLNWGAGNKLDTMYEGSNDSGLLAKDKQGRRAARRGAHPLLAAFGEKADPSTKAAVSAMQRYTNLESPTINYIITNNWREAGTSTLEQRAFVMRVKHDFLQTDVFDPSASPSDIRVQVTTIVRNAYLHHTDESVRLYRDDLVRAAIILAGIQTMGLTRMRDILSRDYWSIHSKTDEFSTTRLVGEGVQRERVCLRCNAPNTGNKPFCKKCFALGDHRVCRIPLCGEFTHCHPPLKEHRIKPPSIVNETSTSSPVFVKVPPPVHVSRVSDSLLIEGKAFRVGDLLITARHFLPEYGSLFNVSVQFAVNVPGQECKFECKSDYVVGGQDIAYLKLINTKCLEHHKCCLQGMPSLSIGIAGVGIPVQMSSGASVKTGKILQFFGKPVPHNNPSFKYNITISHNIHTVGGESGSPIFNVDGKVVAVHTAGGPRSSDVNYGEIFDPMLITVAPNDKLLALHKIDNYTIWPYKPKDIVQHYAKGRTVSVYGECSSRKPPRVDEIFNTYVPRGFKAPGKYRMVSLDDQVGCNTEMRGNFKYDKPIVDIDPFIWQQAEDIVYAEYSPFLLGHAPLTHDDALLSMNWKSSPGLPYTLTGLTKLFFKGEAHLLDDFYRGLPSSTFSMPLWSSSVKIEMRPVEKIFIHSGNENSLRVFCAAPLEVDYVGHRLYYDFVCRLQESSLNTSSALGVSKFFRGFDAMACHLSCGPDTVYDSLDGVQYDSTVHPNVQLFVERLYRQTIDPIALNDVVSCANFWFMYVNLNSLICMMSGVAILKRQGNNSGNYLTILYNIIFGSLTRAYSVIRHYSNRGPSMTIFDNLYVLKAIILGDDICIGSNDPLLIESFKKYASELGVEYEGRGASKDITDHDFCSAFFREYKGCYIPCPDWEKAVDSYYYGSKHNNPIFHLVRALALLLESYFTPAKEILSECVLCLVTSHRSEIMSGSITIKGTTIEGKHVLHLLRSPEWFESMYLGYERLSSENKSSLKSFLFDIRSSLSLHLPLFLPMTSSSSPIHPTQFKSTEPRLVAENSLAWKKKYQNVGSVRDPNHPQHTTKLDVGNHMWSGVSSSLGRLVDEYAIHPLERVFNHRDSVSNQREVESIHKLPYDRFVIPKSQINGNNGSATNTDDHGKGKGKGMQKSKGKGRKISPVVAFVKERMVARPRSKHQPREKNIRPIMDNAGINKSSTVHTPNRRMVFKMTEKIMDVIGTTGFNNNFIYENPGNVKLHPMMGGVFAHYQSFRYRKGRVRYVPSANVAVGNQVNTPDIVIVTNRDVSVAPFADLTSAEEYAGANKGLAYAALTHDTLQGQTHAPSEKLFVNYGNNLIVGNSNATPQLTNIGLVQIITANVASTYNGLKLGEVYFDYEVELFSVHATMNTPATLCTQVQGYINSSSSPAWVNASLLNNMTGVTLAISTLYLTLTFPIGVGGNFMLAASASAATGSFTSSFSLTENSDTPIYGYPSSAGQNFNNVVSSFTSTSCTTLHKFNINPGVVSTVTLQAPAGTQTSNFNIDLCQMSGPMGSLTVGGPIVVGPQIVSSRDLDEKVNPIIDKLARVEALLREYKLDHLMESDTPEEKGRDMGEFDHSTLTWKRPPPSTFPSSPSFISSVASAVASLKQK